MTNSGKQIALQFLLVALFTFILATVWEFFLEDFYHHLFNAHDHKETIEEKWEYVLNATAYVILALIIPFILTIKKDFEKKQAHEDLIENKRQMELFTLAVNDMLWNWDLVNGTVERSIGFEKVFGYQKSEITSDIDWWIDRLHPDDKDRVMSAYKNTVEAGGANVSYNYRFRCKDGFYADICDHAYIVCNKEGKAVRALGAMTDITERKKAEQQLIKSKNYLEKLNNSLGEAIFTVKMPDRKIEYVNRSLETVFGYRADECIGNNTEMFYPTKKSFLDFGKKLKNSIGKGGDALNTEQLLKKKNGEVFQAEITTTFLKENDDIKHVISIVRDISERKKAEQQMILMSEIVNNMTEGVSLARVSDASFVYTNRKYDEIFGYDRGELLGKHVSILNVGVEDSLDRKSSEITACLNETGEWEGELENIKKDGTHFWVYAHVSRFNHEEYGEVSLSVESDITARKKAEISLQESEQSLAVAQRMAHLGNWDLDIKSGKVRWSNEEYHIFGYRPGDIEPTFEQFMDHIHSDDRKVVEEYGSKIISGELSEKSLDFRIIRADGKERIIHEKIDAIHDEQGNVSKLIGISHDITELKEALDEQVQFHELIGTSKPMVDLRRQISEMSKLNWTVLLIGETGTGKELVAKAIHFASNRRDKPFIAVNTAGLSESLLTSQLFGHMKGAFTGAVEDHKGLFESANEGTLYLDEIGDISPNIQVSLLRVMEEKAVVRLGESRERQVDVRIITATHRDLEEEVRQGRFREDLLYRIRIARIGLPPLRERREDIPLLVEHFLEESKAIVGKEVQGLSFEAMRCLIKYGWSGNVRELKSAIVYALLRCKGLVINRDDLPPEILNFVEGKPELAKKPDTINMDITDIKEAIKISGGNRTKAAKLLGISRATLYRRLSS